MKYKTTIEKASDWSWAIIENDIVIATLHKDRKGFFVILPDGVRLETEKSKPVAIKRLNQLRASFKRLEGVKP